MVRWRSLALVLACTTLAAADGQAPRLTPQVVNLLCGAKLSGNLASFERGLRGAPDEIVWDPAKSAFARTSQWHEYGVGFDQAIGAVSAERAAWWLAEWPAPVSANLIVLSGTYPNQPQPGTAWQIELRRDGVWTRHAAGVGGWYDGGLYVWGGVDTPAVSFDALRVSLHSADGTTPLRSIQIGRASCRERV